MPPSEGEGGGDALGAKLSFGLRCCPSWQLEEAHGSSEMLRGEEFVLCMVGAAMAEEVEGVRAGSKDGIICSA